MRNQHAAILKLIKDDLDRSSVAMRTFPWDTVIRFVLWKAVVTPCSSFVGKSVSSLRRKPPKEASALNPDWQSMILS